MTNLSFQLAKLSDSELFESTSEVAKREKETTVELLYHLHEVEKRKLYAARGFGTLWEYVSKYLGYSETQTYERVSAMRLIFRVQEAKKALETGKISVTQAAMAERHLRSEEKNSGTTIPRATVRKLISDVQGKSKRETEKLLLSLRPQDQPVLEKIRPVSEEISEVRFPISEDVRRSMERYWEIRGKSSVSELFSACLEYYLSQKDPMRAGKEKKPKVQKVKAMRKENSGNVQIFPNLFSAAPGALPLPDPSPLAGALSSADALPLPVRVKQRSRYISASVKQEVRERSLGRCEYVDPVTGRRCESRYRLQFDHIEPYFFGGTADLGNIRALCASHNGYLARKMFAREAFESYGGTQCRVFRLDSWEEVGSRGEDF